jgi:hypothetical protein
MNAIQKIKLAYEQLIAKGFDANLHRFELKNYPIHIYDASEKLVAINPTEEEHTQTKK